MIYLIYKYCIFFTVFSGASILNKPENYPRNVSQEIDNDNLKPVVGFQCEHETICEDVMNYPEIFAEKQISMLIESGAILPESTKMVGLRENFYISHDICCQFKKKILPRAARTNEESEWFFILNSLKLPLYTIRSETCRSPGTSCIDKILIFKENYRGVCKQEKTNLLLYAFDKIDDMPTLRNVSVDSWCSCSVTYYTN